MKPSEALGLLAVAHAKNLARAVSQIEALDCSPEEKARQIQAIGDEANREWGRNWWGMLNRFMEDNRNSKLDLADLAADGSRRGMAFGGPRVERERKGCGG